MNHPTHEQPVPAGRRGSIALAVFLAIAGFFLLSEHRAHLFGVLPYLLVLACPLMHLFHHGGHGHHSARREGAEEPPHDARVPGS